MANPINLDETEYTPFVKFDPDNRSLQIGGESRPENPARFFGPVLTEIRVFTNEHMAGVPIDVTFQMEYFNTASSKYLYDLLMLFEEMRDDVMVNWEYASQDEIIKEAGEMLEEATELKFNFRERPDS